ncbi:AsmA family protein [Pseudahrensia aquimaris]
MKRIIIAAVVIVALVATVFLALPRLLSADTIKAAIERELSRISGQSVSLNGEARVSLRPYLGLNYTNIRIGGPPADDSLLTAEELQVQLQASSVLFGDPAIKSLHLVRPHFRFKIDEKGKPNWALDTSAKPDQPIAGMGLVSISEGIVSYSNQLSDRKEQITAIRGTINWPKSGQSAAVNVAGIWNGEAFDAEINAQQPTALLTQGISRLNATLSAAPVQLSYVGSITRTSATMFDGDFQITAPSATRFSEWIKRPLPAAALIERLALSGQLTGSLDRLILSNTNAQIGEAVGEGRLSFEIDESLIAINGTLAFDTIILPTLAELGRPVGPSDVAGASIAQGLAMDVRLSANSATSGPLAMQNLAASLFVKDGKALFDVAQAEALDGQVAGTFQPRTDAKLGFSSDLKLTGIDLEQLAGLYGEGKISLRGRGDARFKLESVAPTADVVLTRLNGSGSVSGQNGTLVGVDLNAISRRLADPGTIRSADVFDGSTSYGSMNIAFYIANGIAFFQNTKLEVDDITVTLSGRSDLEERNLALQGRILQTREAAQGSSVPATVSMPFLVGGTASSPLFIPLPANIQNGGPPNAIPQAPSTE